MEEYTEVINALSKIKKEHLTPIINLANKTSQDELIQNFNQSARDFFALVNEYLEICNLSKEEKKECSMSVYETTLETTIKYNKRLPILNFCKGPLIWAENVYYQNYEDVMKTDIDSTASVEFGGVDVNLFQFNKHRKLWLSMDKEYRDQFDTTIFCLTQFAHAYLIRMASGKK